MAPTTRRSVSKKRRNSNAKIGEDSEARNEETHVNARKDDDSSDSEDELSDADLDLEKLAADSASQILSRLRGTQALQKNMEVQQRTMQKEHLRKSKRTVALLAGRDNSSKMHEMAEEEDGQTDNKNDTNEVQFVIDTKPFSRQTASKDFLDEIDNAMPMESDSDTDSQQDSDDASSDNELLTSDQQLQRESQSKTRMTSLRAQISEEIAKITERRDDG